MLAVRPRRCEAARRSRRRRSISSRSSAGKVGGSGGGGGAGIEGLNNAPMLCSPGEVAIQRIRGQDCRALQAEHALHNFDACHRGKHQGPHRRHGGRDGRLDHRQAGATPCAGEIKLRRQADIDRDPVEPGIDHHPGTAVIDCNEDMTKPAAQELAANEAPGAMKSDKRQLRRLFRRQWRNTS